eukprot:CAMPEP_0119014510 /NCGR_PEP_ID=MMETSP1176-20130426/9861_1 /TAXON_ID=265551 /ORGANISM="Synedropsis recta cf, Strain CCMP1620" /LENGTH=398 /DNA_ID=CAMNT_0006967699 /DNA_START=47 /DNA_END=1243 /DNA_ORIENTATION=+
MKCAKRTWVCIVTLVLTMIATTATTVDGLSQAAGSQHLLQQQEMRSYACYEETAADTRLFSTSASVGGEPAGVTTMFLGKRERLKGTARSVMSFLRPSIQHKHDLPPPQVGEDIVSAEWNLPAWACEDAEEKSRLTKMKYLLKDDFSALSNKEVFLTGVGKNVKVVEAFPDVYSDLRLLRFLRKDKVQNPAAAADRFRRFLTWRQEFGADTIRAAVENSPFHPSTAGKGEEEVKRFIPCDFCQNDQNDGEGVTMLLHIGDWNTAGITAKIESGALSLEDFLAYWAFMFESLAKKLHEDTITSKKMLYVDQICDLTTLSMQQFSPRFVTRVLKPWLSLTQNNYPETAKRIIFFHPPRILRLIWALVTPLVSPGTVAKVELNRDFKGTSEQFMRSECIAG